jgi:HK97 family phage major capsid protein
MSGENDSKYLAPEVGDELKKMGREVQSALTALRDSTEAKNVETVKNVEKFMNKYQDEADKFAREFANHQKSMAEVTAKFEAAEAELKKAGPLAAEAKARLDKMEMQLATKSFGHNGGPAWAPNDPKHPDRTDSAEYKNFMVFLKEKNADFEVKTLRSDNETQGAYLIPQIMDNQIRKNITEISPVRLFARVRNAPGKTMDIPRRLALLAAYYEGETETSPTDQSVYGSEQITLYRQTVTVPATLDMMISSAFDLEQEIAADVGESFGQSEGTAFVNGTGQKGPQGFIKDSRCEVVQTANTGDVDFNDMAEIAGKLKRGQAPWWFMNRRTLAKMWQIKSTIGVPIWSPVAGNTPATIWGFPVCSDMISLEDAQTGSNAKPIVFGDLRRGYEIFDMVGISVIRDDLTRKKEAITEWTFRRYNTGRVIIPEAIKILKIK